MNNNIVTSLEFLLFSLISFLTIAGYCDGIGKEIPYSFEIAATILFSTLLLFFYSALKNKNDKISPIISFGIASLALTINHLTAPELADHNLTTLPVFYFMIVLLTGLIGRKYAWLPPFLLFTAGEYIHFVVLSSESITAVSLQDFPEYLRAIALPSFYLLLAGFFTSMFSSHIFLLADNEDEKNVEKSVTSQQNPAKKEPQESQSNPKTQNLVIDHSLDTKTIPGNNVDELLASVVYFMKRNFKAYSALGFIFDLQRQALILNSVQSKSINIKKGILVPIGDGVIGKIGSEKRIFMSGDLSYYNSDITYYSSSEEVNSILAVPVISEKDELLGVLALDSLDKNAFKEADKDILKRFSSLAAALITNARMRIFQERAARTFQIFYEASHQLTTALNIGEVFNVLFQMAPSTSHCTRQMAILFNEEDRKGMIFKVFGNSPELSEGFEFPINAGLYSFAFKKRKIVNINDFQLYRSKYYRFVPEEYTGQDLRSLIIFPVLDDEFRCKGLYSIESDIPNLFTGEVEQILTTLVENASVAFTRALLYQRMERLATTDGLTELNNHRHFQELLSRELERSKRYSKPVSLLLMDIDHFKSFNDTYGHPVGDLVLKEIAACIRKSLRLNDIPARYGGEEFTVIIPETSLQGAVVIAERIRSTIEQHIIISLDRQLRVTVSIGVACYPDLADSQQSLIDNADKALYHSKENGRNRVTIFAPGMGGKKK